MSVSKKLIDAVNVGSIADIRDCLIAALLDSTGKSYEDSILYCRDNGITNIFEKHDGGSDISLPASRENSAELLGQLRINFSEERVNARLAMGKILSRQKKNTNILTQPTKVTKAIDSETKSDITSNSKEDPLEIKPAKTKIIEPKPTVKTEIEPEITHEEKIISVRRTPDGEGKKNNSSYGKFILAGCVAIIIIAAIITCSNSSSKKQQRSDQQGSSYSTTNK